MRFVSLLLGTVVTLAFLGLLGWGLYWGIQQFGGFFGLLSQEQQATLSIVGSIAVFCSFVVAWAVYYGASQRKQATPEKNNAYDMFIELFAERELIIQEGGEESIQLQLNRLRQFMVLWSSDKVLKAFMQWDILQAQNGHTNPLAQSQGEKVLLLIRKDLHKDTAYFKQGELLSLVGTKELQKTAIN